MNLSNYIEQSEKYKSAINFSTKLVIPTFCNAKCPFCFNKWTNTQVSTVNDFLNNYQKSLNDIITFTGNRSRSLDLTGNEPTFNPDMLKEVVNNIDSSKFDLVTLTTNGFKLLECVPIISEKVNIVNISTHHYDIEQRRKIFGIKNVLTDDDYKKVINELHNKHIHVTCVVVIYEPVDDFSKFYENIKNWAKSVGFDSLRYRSNFMEDNEFVAEYFSKMPGNAYFTPGLTFKTNIDEDGFSVRFAIGVPEIIPYIIGVESVIDSDGKLYLDYNKTIPFEPNFGKNVYVNRLFETAKLFV